MKVFHIVSNKVWGGGEQYVFDLCQHLIADGNEVEILCRDVKSVTDKLSKLDINITLSPLRGIVDTASAYRLAAIIGKQSCAVHVHNFKDAFTAAYARILSRNKNMRIIVTRHLVKKGKTGMLYSWLYRQIDAIIFVSNLAKQEFLLSNPKIKAEKLHVIHNSIVLRNHTENVEDLRKTLGIPAENTLLMYHGRLAKEKGVEVLLKALAKISSKDTHLIMIGTGDEKYVASLETTAKEQGIADRLHLIGFRNNVLSYIKQADIGVMPSIARESFMLAGLEYMSQGKCLITTDNGGQKEYIADGVNAFLCKADDIDSLTSTLNKVIDDVSIREKTGKKALESFETSLKYDVFYGNILQLYNNIIK